MLLATKVNVSAAVCLPSLTSLAAAPNPRVSIKRTEVANALFFCNGVALGLTLMLSSFLNLSSRLPLVNVFLYRGNLRGSAMIQPPVNAVKNLDPTSPNFAIANWPNIRSNPKPAIAAAPPKIHLSLGGAPVSDADVALDANNVSWVKFRQSSAFCLLSLNGRMPMSQKELVSTKQILPSTFLGGFGLCICSSCVQVSIRIGVSRGKTALSVNRCT